MAKLFPNEKLLRECFEAFKVEVPYGFVYDNPFDGFSQEGKFKSGKEYSASFDFFTFDDKIYVDVTILVGTRTYTGLFDGEDERLIFYLVDKFIKINKEV